jgi:hypothetical protein
MKILLLLAPILLAACASLSEKSYTLPENLQATLGPDQAIACRFSKQASGADGQPATNWFFWREPQRTESRDALSNQGELWERNQAGQFFYTRLFYREKVALEFVPGDLAAIGSSANWAQLSSLIDPNLLGKELTLTKKSSQNGNAVEYFTGTIHGIATEVDWLPSVQLPARLVKKLPEGEITLTLLECTAKTGLGLQPINKAELDSFRRLNYTDLGDMEDDPMVRHLEHLMGGHHHADH